MELIYTNWAPKRNNTHTCTRAHTHTHTHTHTGNTTWEQCVWVTWISKVMLIYLFRSSHLEMYYPSL